MKRIFVFFHKVRCRILAIQQTRSHFYINITLTRLSICHVGIPCKYVGDLNLLQEATQSIKPKKGLPFKLQYFKLKHIMFNLFSFLIFNYSKNNFLSKWKVVYSYSWLENFSEGP